MPYGAQRAELCHVFPARPRGHGGARETAALLFVHGGHWQQSGIDEACFAAPHAVAHGCAFVAVGYGLAPTGRCPR